MIDKFKTARVQITGALLLALSATLPACADYQSTVLSQGPSGYWRLNETTQPQAAVTTAAKLGSLRASANGTYEGSQGCFRGFPGALASSDTAAKFDGASQDVLVPYNAALSTPTFSAECWVNADEAAGQCIISCGQFGSPRAGWLIYQNGAGGFDYRMYNTNGLNFSLRLTTTGVNVVGSYVHLAATFDGTTARVYVNGNLAASGTPTASTKYVPGESGGFSFGMRSDTGFRWAGKLDEVALYR